MEDRPEETCRHCGTVMQPLFVLREHDTPHYGEYRCTSCGRHLCWEKKPKNEGTRGKNRYTAKAEGITRCQLCQRTLNMLGKNEVIDCHHVLEIENGGKDEHENIWWVCTSCHKAIHHRRTYMMRNQIETISLADLRSQFEEYSVPQESRVFIERIFEKTQQARSI